MRFGEHQPHQVNVLNLRVGVKINAVQIAVKAETGRCRTAAVLPCGGKKAVQREVNHAPAAAEAAVKRSLARHVERALVTGKRRKFFNNHIFASDFCLKINVRHQQIAPAEVLHIARHGQRRFALHAGLPVNCQKAVQRNGVLRALRKRKILNAICVQHGKNFAAVNIIFAVKAQMPVSKVNARLIKHNAAFHNRKRQAHIGQLFAVQRQLLRRQLALALYVFQIGKINFAVQHRRVLGNRQRQSFNQHVAIGNFKPACQLNRQRFAAQQRFRG